MQTDLVTALDRLAPDDAPWVHDVEGPDDMPAHVKAMLTGVSLHVPVRGGALALGTWQGIYLVEHRAPAASARDAAAIHRQPEIARPQHAPIDAHRCCERMIAWPATHAAQRIAEAFRLSDDPHYRLVIADDHPLFRGALREAVAGLFERADIAEAGTFDEVAEAARAAAARSISSCSI